MQQQTRKYKRTSGKDCVLLLAALFLCLLPILLIGPGWEGFFLVGCNLCLYFAGLAFWMRFFPPHPQGQIRQAPFFLPFLIHIFSGKRTVASITDGQFDRDYFALRKKPALRSIIIDSHSVAAIKAADGRLSILHKGHWQLEHGETVEHIFDLRPGFFAYGPQSTDNPFHLLQRSQRDPVSQHTAKMEIEETQCTFADGIIIAPVFSIVYCWKDPVKTMTFDRQLADISFYLAQQNFFGQANQQVERMLGSVTAQIFRSFTHNAPRDAQSDPMGGIDRLQSAFQQMIAYQDMGALAKEAAIGEYTQSLLGLVSFKLVLDKIWVA
jgi:hypothetical protein